ncbi:uncharacterized protein LOC108904825 isoform X2 [Anoplophora glabripennis]|uniref:uncharacterized protein LOC108904825 isoform X2 n=1 Tax=Anoplophora glabripennis TaxID=217634 RepID=UPI0008758982|nr:uncharacterized protein LOC108904825 isoform X2 [Anoplophora glabripennis]
MNTYTLFTFVVALSAASAGVIAPSAAIIQGPSRKTTLVGPEGSVISAVAPGGQIITEEHPGVVAHAVPSHGPIVAAPVHAAPVYAAPVHAAPFAASPVHGVHAVAPQVIAAVIVDDVAAFPAGAAHHGASFLHAIPAAHGVAEGQYVHDHAEALYDDGSYKPHLH